MKKEAFGYLKYHLPFEVKENASLISLFITLFLVYVLNGFLLELGRKLFDWTLTLKTPFYSEVLQTIDFIAVYPIQINPLIILVFILLFYSSSRFINKLKLKEIVIFEDDFDFANKGWGLNYWGSNDPDKTCRFEKSAMVFRGEESDLKSLQKENGACIDLTEGIYQGSRYEISCRVKADKATNLGFKLWAHDAHGRAEIKSPTFIIPSDEYEEVKIGFIATRSKTLRVHLHYKAGKGEIYVDRVKVVKVS